MKRSVGEDLLVLSNNNGEQLVEMREQMGDNEICTVYLKGKIGNEASYDIADELYALASVGKGIVLDIGDVTFLCVPFVETLVNLQVKMEKTSFESLLIHNMPEPIYSFLEKEGFIHNLDYEMKEDA